MLDKLDVKEWLALNAKLQAKKNALRHALKEKGTIKKDKQNTFDKYAYLSEAGYKALFTELLSEHGLELTSSEEDYTFFETKNTKQPSGRIVKFRFRLTDVETGFYEESYVTGEGIDKGDKAGYKADTGAIKYYLANTFLVATGDDAEAESPTNGNHNARPQGKPMNAGQRAFVDSLPPAWKQNIGHHYGTLELTEQQALEVMQKWKAAQDKAKAEQSARNKEAEVTNR